jgi:hypothetical protein
LLASVLFIAVVMDLLKGACQPWLPCNARERHAAGPFGLSSWPSGKLMLVVSIGGSGFAGRAHIPSPRAANPNRGTPMRPSRDPISGVDGRARVELPPQFHALLRTDY